MLDEQQVFTPEPMTDQAISRRNLVRAGAWSAPVIAVAVASPLATATESPIDPLNTDIVLSFAGGRTGSTTDISDAAIDWIKERLLELGPQVPPQPVEPKREDYPSGVSGTLQFRAAHAAWVVESARWFAENAEVIAQRALWEGAVRQLENLLNRLAGIGEMLFSVTINYPERLVVSNAGPAPILPGQAVTVTTTVDSPLFNAHFPSIGEVGIIQTGGTSTMTFIAQDTIPAGGVVFEQPLRFNPAAVTLNISGSTTTSSITAELDPRDQDVDFADNGDVVTAPIGIQLDVLSDLPGALAEWEQIQSQLEDLRELWELISPYIDWQDIIGGLLPLPLP